MAPLPDDDGRKPGDQQAWTPAQRHALTRYVDEEARTAIEAFTTLPEDADSLDRQRARYTALKAARVGRSCLIDEVSLRVRGGSTPL